MLLTVCEDEDQHCNDAATNASLFEEASVLQEDREFR